MSTNLPSFRYPYTFPDDVHPAVKNAMRLTFQGIDDLNQAIAKLVPKVNANATAVATVTKVTTLTAASGGSVPSTIGAVNLQPNLTPGAYTPVSSDLGALLVVQSSVAFALTLNSGLTAPFYFLLQNLGAGLVTLTPTTGTINNVASLTVSTNNMMVVFFDGTNWWAMYPLIPPAPLTGKSASLGGSLMTTGQTITTTVTITGAAVGMVAETNPETYPGDGFVWSAYISSANTVTVRVTCVLAGTPSASLYDVRVIR